MLRLSSFRFLVPFALTLATGCTSAPPIRLQRIEIKEETRERQLSDGEHLQSGQRFGLRFISKLPLYIYVVFEHANGSHEKFYPKPGIPEQTMQGEQRLPVPGNWYPLPQLAAGDQLCLIASEQREGAPSCKEEDARKVPKRGEDTPPPAPDGEKSSDRSSPPPDDTSSTRGQGKWVIRLPL